MTASCCKPRNGAKWLKQIRVFILLTHQGHWEMWIWGRVGFRGLGHAAAAAAANW